MFDAQTKTSFITAPENAFSGSKHYVSTKTPAEALLKLNNAFAKLLGIIDPSLEEKHKAQSDETLKNKLVHSPDYAKGMIKLGKMLGADSYVNDRLNYRFFTHNNIASNKELNGSLNAIEGDAILNYFPPGSDSSEWPNLILTASHALVKSHHDVSGIMKGIHALVRDIFPGNNGKDDRRLRLLERTDDTGKTPSNGKASILISSVYNDHNAWVNGGTLLQRLNFLDGLFEQEQRREELGIADDDEAKAWREKWVLGEKDWAMSPASIRLAKLMLKLIVEQPDEVEIPGREQFTKSWRDDLTLSYNTKPLTLRDDARDVLQHIKLVGYSKGGNIVTDALRYLALDLRHGEPVRLRNGHDAPQPITMDEMRSLLMNTGALALNPGVSPLTQHEKRCGIRRLSVRNPEDWITAHLFDRHHLKKHDGTNDDIYDIHPKVAPSGLGHAPEAALGNMDKGLSGYLADGEKVQSDPNMFDEMVSRLQCFLASCHEKSGIKSVREDGNVIHLEFSAGASKRDTERVVDELESTLKPAVSGSSRTLKITHDWQKSCEFTIEAPANTNAPLSATADNEACRMQRLKEQLGNALLTLEQKDITFVGHNVYHDLGVAPPQRGKSAA